MIHYKREGEHGKVGLNITVSKWWIAFVWVMVDPMTLKGVRYYIRFRLLPGGPKIFTSIDREDLFQGRLWDLDLTTLTREQVKDRAIEIRNLESTIAYLRKVIKKREA